uniref:SFRICE_000775 n=1 Tax=Spodoptera frugiperda TaxID=7108 RepID=A0A2H1V9G6_SPOFR
MEFLDSLDLDTIDKKSHRVRSWYLYEQYKSLERSQLDAAQKLKDRSYQDRILRQELSERRARRKLYDQFGLCQSESRIKKDKSESTRSSVSASNDDFFDSFCALNEDEQVTQVTGTVLSEDSFSRDCLSASVCCMDKYKGTEEQHKDDNCSDAGSVNSVVENQKQFSDEVLSPKEMQFLSNSIAQDINMQFDSVKEDLRCLEKFTKLEDVDKISDEDESVTTVSVGVVSEPTSIPVIMKSNQEDNNNLIAIWSRLVSFAYQFVQLNHGNTYCDYSSQFLTAVLACDVLRRGVNSMCNILQPYVSPIKFANYNGSDVSNESYEDLNLKRKKSVQSRKCSKTCDHKPQTRKKARTWAKTRYSDYGWQPLCKRSLHRDKEVRARRRSSEPWHSAPKLQTSKVLASSSTCSLWPDNMTENYCKKQRTTKRRCNRNKAIHPMLEIARYIDRILMDIDDSNP